jgi:hypothetical protein
MEMEDYLDDRGLDLAVAARRAEAATNPAPTPTEPATSADPLPEGTT